MPALDAEAQVFVITRTFKAPRARVWDAWTKPELFAQWYGPKGCVTTIKSADVRPGGTVLAWMDTPGGALWGRFVYRDMTAPSRLVWVQSVSNEEGEITRAPFFGGRWPREMLTEVVFEDLGVETRVTLTWTPLNAEDDERANFVGNIPSMHGGFGGSFDQLEELLAR
jgi:uncharacterized protein YndB with AHSA1/START domain